MYLVERQCQQEEAFEEIVIQIVQEYESLEHAKNECMKSKELVEHWSQEEIEEFITDLWSEYWTKYLTDY
jgi:metal-responsive CopG/Arc/MetJ family transcriptional regulator